jgi:DNA-binding response OmpR family regulator
LHEDTDTRAIDNFVVRLRRYIEEDPSRPKHLQTVRGVGYRFVAEPQ